MKPLPLPWGDCALVLSALDFADAERSFTAEELATAAAFRLEKRRAEWLAARMAAKVLATRRGLCADPRACTVARPRLVVSGIEQPLFVSISHSAPYAGAAIDQRPVGIDVQVVRDVSEAAAHLFLSDAETEAMRRCDLPHRLLHFWAAKEAAWKQRSDEVPTMKQLRLALLGQRGDGLLFDAVETVAVDDVIVALTRSTS